MTVEHAYDILGLPPTASWPEVQRAYRQLALLHHPDRATRHGEEAEAAFNRYADAYRLLRREEVRRRHDRGANRSRLRWVLTPPRPLRH